MFGRIVAAYATHNLRACQPPLPKRDADTDAESRVRSRVSRQYRSQPARVTMGSSGRGTAKPPALQPSEHSSKDAGTQEHFRDQCPSGPQGPVSTQLGACHSCEAEISCSPCSAAVISPAKCIGDKARSSAGIGRIGPGCWCRTSASSGRCHLRDLPWFRHTSYKLW